MLFTKRRFSVVEGRIREDIRDDDGRVVLKLNLRFPEIKCGDRDPMAGHARRLYSDLSKGFADYARGELKAVATRACRACGEGFLPFSALMSYSVTLDDGRLLSVSVDISVSDGIGRPRVVRKTQVWDRTRGLKCDVCRFLSKETVKRFAKSLSEEERKAFDRSLFSVDAEGVCFYLLTDDGYSERRVGFDTLKN